MPIYFGPPFYKTPVNSSASTYVRTIQTENKKIEQPENGKTTVIGKQLHHLRSYLRYGIVYSV